MSAADKRQEWVGREAFCCGRYESKFLYWPVMTLRGQIATVSAADSENKFLDSNAPASIHFFGLGSEGD